MTQQAVTELIVRGDGALAVLDRFEDKMVDAGRASDRSTGAIDRYNAAMQKFATAQEKGLAITTQRVERQTAEQRAMERWQGTVDKTMQMEIRLRREAQRAAVDMANAVALGYTTQEKAIVTLIGLEQRHAAQLAESAVMLQRMAGAEAVVGGRFDAATAAINRNTTALRANHTAGSFNTANIAAQFQDIGVTMAMGMSPLQIALQQGTQLSAVFEQMKASGQSVAVGLRSAFLSVVSPVSLVTVGVIAATAAIVQWATSAEDESDKASKALEAHADVISRIKEKYGEAAKELKAYADESAVILKAAAIQAREANEAIVSEASQDVVNKMLNMPGSAFGAGTPLLSSFSKALSDLESSLAAGTPRLLEFRNAMASIRTSDYATAEQKALADSFLEMTKEAEKAARSLPSSAAAIEMTGNRARTSTTDVEGFAKALRDLAGIAVPALTDAERAQDALRKALAGASDIVERKAALDAYHDTLVRINNEIEGAKVPLPVARPNDIERLDGEAKAAGKAEESYDRLFDSAQRRLDQMQTELGLIGQAGAAVESYRMEQDLLARAKEREIDLSPKQRDEIHALAQAYGEVTQAAAEARMASGLMFERAQLGRSEIEQRVAEAMRRLHGDDYGDYMDSALAAEIRITAEMERQRHYAEAVRDTLKEGASGFLQDLFTGKDLMESIVQLGSRFASMNFDKFVDSLFDKPSMKAAGKTMGAEIVQVVSDGIDHWAGMRGNDAGASLAGSVGSYTNARAAGAALGAAATPVMTKALNPMAVEITKAANQLGVSARDLATVISYETGGSFSTKIMGGKNNDYLGLIQFGPEERRKYGAYWGQAFGDQMQAAVRYFKDRGLQPGMGIRDLYSTILTGSPGNYNRTDGYGTVDQHLTRMAAHQAKADALLAGMPDEIKTASEKGTAKGAEKGTQSGLVIAANSPASAGGLQAAAGLAGAGLGGFSTGYQSANPGMGLLGGALQGWGAGSSLAASGASLFGLAYTALPVIGAVVGAIGGLLGGIFGARKKVKEARRELEKNMNAINDLLAIGFGKGMGTFQKRLSDYLAEVDKGVDLAWKAKNMDLVHTLQESWNSMFWRLRKDFYDIFDETAAGYSSGLGLEAPALKGAKAISDLREELRNWIADVEYFGKKAMENDQKVVDAGGEPSPAYYEQMKLLKETMARAKEAAAQMILGFVGGAEQFTEYETAVQSLKGTVDVAQTALEELGWSADDAAKAIEAKLNVALYKLRNNLSTDLTRSLNDLSGFSYLNEFLDAQVAYENRLRDLKALGMDTGIAMSELTQRLSNIAKEAELTDDNLTALAGAFPQLSGALLGLIGGSLGTPQQVLDDAKAKVEEAKNALRESFEKEISTLEEAKSAHDNYIKSIQKFLDDLKLDDQLSPLDPTQRFQEAQKQYLETTQLALSGDKDAIEKVEDVSRQYLEEARAYYGTSEGYFSIFNDVESTLSSILTGAKQHLSELEQQLAVMEAQRDAQLGTTDAVLSVEEAINRLAAATAAEAAAQKAYDSAQDAMIQQMLELLKQTGQAYDPFITSLYRDVLGRAPDAEGAAYYTNMLNSGVSQEEIRRRFVANAQPELDRGYPAFADGGYHAGGPRLVGERGPELEMTGASRIWNASDTSRILSQAWQPQNYAFANDNSAAALLKEVQALRQEVAAFREDRKEGDGIVAAGAQATVAAAEESTDMLRKQRADKWREAGRRWA